MQTASYKGNLNVFVLSIKVPANLLLLSVTLPGIQVALKLCCLCIPRIPRNLDLKGVSYDILCEEGRTTYQHIFLPLFHICLHALR